MKRKVLFQMAGILLISYFCSLYLFSSKKDISGFEASDFSEVYIHDYQNGTNSHLPEFRAKMWDLVYAHNITSHFDLPFSMFEYRGKLYMTSERLPGDAAPLGQVHEYDMTDLSAPKRSFVIPGVTGGYQLSGFTTDGTYLYAVNGTDDIFVINPEPMSVIDYITVSGLSEAPVSIAYDRYREGFWVAAFNRYEIYFVDKTGEKLPDIKLQSSTSDGGIKGLAYDDRTAGGPYLWVSTGNDYMNSASVGRIVLSTGEYSKEKDLLAAISIIDNGFNDGGGLYIYGDLSRGKTILTGTVIGEKNENMICHLYGFELEDYPLGGTPAAPSSLEIIPAPAGGNSATVKWKNPSVTAAGNTLASISEVKVYRENEVVDIQYNPAPGQEMTFIDRLASAGMYSYKVIAENTIGEGIDAIKRSYIGYDLPLAVKNLTAIGENGSAKISWNPPTGGQNGGYIDESELQYTIERHPDNRILALNLNATSYTDNNINSLNNYSYTVTAKTVTGNGIPTTSNHVRIGEYISVPWNEHFDTKAAFDLWTVIDADGLVNSSNWEYTAAGGYTTPGAVRITQSRNTSTDSWLISPPLRLEAGKKYWLNWFDNAGNANRTYQVNTGTSPTVEAQTKTLLTPNAGQYDPYTEREVLLEVDTDNTYYVSWNIKNNYTGMSTVTLTIDDIVLKEIPDADMVAISLNGPIKPSIMRESVYYVTVRNRGGATATNFQVALINASGTELTSVTYNGQIETNQYGTVAVPWTPAQAGEQAIRAKITINGDADESDNMTEEFSIDVQEAGMLGIQIGIEENLNWMPFSYYNQYSFIQTIYYEHEIQDAGLIENVIYFNDFSSNVIEERPIKIYMAMTDKDEVTEWDMENAVLVFDGNYDFPGGKNENLIPLQQPFSYTGKNLIITTHRTDIRYHGRNNWFKTSFSEEYQHRTRQYTDDYQDFDFSQVGVTTNEYPNIVLMMNTNVGKLSGKVSATDGTLFPDITITVKETDTKIVTNSQAEYVTFLPPGTYTLEIFVVGYETLTQTITIDKEDSIEYNFELIPLHGIILTGKVADEKSNAIENVTVQLTGYENYRARTDATGNFRIENVYINEEYTLTVEKSGYTAHVATLNVLEDDIVLDNLVLESCGNATIKNLSHTFAGADGYSVVLDWYHPHATDGKLPPALYAGNDKVVTTPAGAIDGWDLSEVWDTDGMGFIADKNLGYSIADDFVLEEEALVTDMDFYVYQNSITVPKVEAIYVRIYDGSPMEGGNVIWGDMDTNVLESQEFIGCYRVKEKSDFGINDRTNPVIRAKAQIMTELPAGTYWVEVQFESQDANRNITLIPCSAKDRRITGNSLVCSKGVWEVLKLGAVSDYATQEMAFRVNGVAVDENYTVKYKIYRDDKHIQTVLHYQYAHTDIVPTYGNYTYEVAAIWNNGCESERVKLDVAVAQNPCEIPVTEFPFFESFESGFPSCWTHTFVNGGNRFEAMPGYTNRYISKAHTGVYNLSFSAIISAGDAARVTSPALDTRGLDTPYLSFYHAQEHWHDKPDRQDILRVYYRIGKNGDIVKLAEYTENISEWTRRIIELPVKSEELYILFEAESGEGKGVLLDDVTVSDDGCFPVSNFTVTQAGEVVWLNWAEPGVPDLGTYTIRRNGQEIATGLTIDYYVDEEVEDGEAYEYCIYVDYTGKGKGCDTSEEVCVNYTVNIDDCEAVANLTAQVSDNAVYLTWDLEYSDDIVQIALARNYETYAISSSYQTEFLDDDVQYGETYSYCIIVVYKDRTCSQSISVCLTDIIVGVENKTMQADYIKIYPNPANNGYIKVAGDHIEQISLLNATGQLLETIRYNEPGEKTILLERYAAGIYFIQVQTKDKQTTTRKFIIN